MKVEVAVLDSASLVARTVSVVVEFERTIPEGVFVTKMFPSSLSSSLRTTHTSCVGIDKKNFIPQDYNCIEN